MTAAAAKSRTLIDGLPMTRSTACGCCALHSVAASAANGRTIGLYHLATGRTFAHFAPGCQDQLRQTRSQCGSSAVRLVLTSSPGERRTVRRGLRAEVGHEPVAVAPVDRVDELHDLAALGAGDPLEQKRRRVERD